MIKIKPLDFKLKEKRTVKQIFPSFLSFKTFFIFVTVFFGTQVLFAASLIYQKMEAGRRARQIAVITQANQELIIQ